MSVQERIGMPMDAFIAAQSEQPFELIDGERVPKMPTVSGHNEVAKRMFLALLPYEQQGHGSVYFEATYVLTDSPQWVKGSRIPDVMFVTTAKLTQFRQQTEDASSKPYILIPDLVIEVVSPTDSYSLIDERVTRYLNDGVSLIWVVDPQRKSVVVHTSAGQQRLAQQDTLTGGDVLPGFTLAVSKIFAGIEA